MTYEANIQAYGIFCIFSDAVPHDIDWVKDRVRWYWDKKYLKQHQLPIKEPTDSKVETDKRTEVKETTVTA
jgi:hypothetical protein